MVKTVVNSQNAPEAIGPYSHAVSSDGLVFCSGMVGLDPSSGALVEESIQAQTRRALQNLGAVLESAGAGFGNVVKVTAYLTDMGQFAGFNEAYGEFFRDDPPARATVGVAALPLGAMVEVECVARL
ncbi:MAG: Rid family detoxifying hydrolase [Actinomycetota bacterium]|jgi:2-iminobutanoate/2-iminopropanoate deaminase|nr:Rid family detoxifying hydrolase [Actinomycetota bacterium]